MPQRFLYFIFVYNESDDKNLRSALLITSLKTPIKNIENELNKILLKGISR